MSNHIPSSHQAVRAAYIIAAILISGYTGLACAADYRMVIREHRFIPDQLDITAGEKHRLIIINQDSSAEEFESYELNREKVIPAHTRSMIFLPPLQPGQYPFFGEFHPHSAQGHISVK